MVAVKDYSLPILVWWDSQIKHSLTYGVQWFSGRMLGLRPMDYGFDPHRRHCVVSLTKTHLSLLSTGLTQEDPS